MTETPDTHYGWNPEMSIPLLLKLKADLKTALLQKKPYIEGCSSTDYVRISKADGPIDTGKRKKVISPENSG